MKIQHLYIIILILIICSCQENPAWTKSNWTEDQYKPEIIELTKSYFNDNNVIISSDSLLAVDKNIIKVVDTCRWANVFMSDRRLIYKCLVYDSKWTILYESIDDIAYLSKIDFSDSKMIIKTPKINLSNQTKIKDFKKHFPNAYSHRNIGTNPYSENGYEWIYLKDDITKENQLIPNQIELRFKDGYLAQFEYHWQPIYSNEEWKKVSDWQESQSKLFE